jgi:myosin-1
VRCIKPNDSKRSSFWESERVLHQIQYLGLLQNVLVRRAGFAFRDTFVRFMNRYKMLCAQTWPSWDIKKADKACLLIMEELKFSADKFQMGKTKIFIKDPMTMKVLESKRSVRVAQLMILISAHAKACAPRLFFQDFKAARLLQTRWRGFMARRNFLQFKAAELLQSVMKGTMFRVDKQKFMSCTYIQRSFRFYLTRKWPIQTRITLSEMLTPKKSRRRISTDLYPIRFYIPELVSSGAIEDLFKATGDSRVLFVEHAVKYGTKFKTRDRVLIVSNLAVFDVEYFPKKRKEKMLVLHHRFSLHSISQLSLLPLHDNFVGVHMSTLYDLAYCLDHKSEFVSVVCEQYSSVVKRDLSVVVCKEISLRMRDDKIRVLVSGSVEEKCDRVCGLRVDKHNSDRGIVYVRDAALSSIP